MVVIFLIMVVCVTTKLLGGTLLYIRNCLFWFNFKPLIKSSVYNDFSNSVDNYDSGLWYWNQNLILYSSTRLTKKWRSDEWKNEQENFSKTSGFLLPPLGLSVNASSTLNPLALPLPRLLSVPTEGRQELGHAHHNCEISRSHTPLSPPLPLLYYY